MKRIILLAIVMLAGARARAAHADDAVAQYSLGRGEQPHAGMPFTLDVVIEGFDEQPQPKAADLAIAGATVAPLDARPNVSRSIQIINGQRSDQTRVTWVMRWRVTAAKEGKLRLPALTITQGSKRVTAQGAELSLEAVPTTDAMKLSIGLPSRPVFVGENLPVTLTWLFRGQPQSDPQFDVPMLGGDDFTIGTPPGTAPNARTLKLHGGGKDLDLPFNVDQIDEGGRQFNRVTVTFFAAPKRAGKLELAPASVAADLPIGRPDIFGSAPSKMFRADDTAHTLEVKPLPETDRPSSFSGAVGTEFSIAVATSRSVVQLGEPVELAITVKSNERLDTLALGKLDGEGQLPKDKFTVPADPPTGELSADGKTKTFKVTAQVTGPATEIPAIAFAYFDPVKGAYQTIHSDPIAVSVKGGSVVSAADVVAAAPKNAPHAAPEAELALVGADLALSAPAEAGERAAGGAFVWALIALFYVVPLVLLGLRTYQIRTRDRREDAAEVATARRAVEQLLARAGKDPGRETAGPLAAALRALARTLARPADDGASLLARLETESFAPGAAASPLSADVRQAAEELARKWTADARRARKAAPGAASIAMMIFVALAAGHAQAHAQAIAATPAAMRTNTGAMTPPAAASAEQLLATGRTAYQDAMSLPDASARKAAFGRAAEALAEAAAAEPDHPELLADWGNAALGAGDVAAATLAYRRALALDGGNARARRNLAWLRSRQPDAMRPGDAGAADTLLFFHRWPRARRALVGALAFALAVLLVVPWRGRRRGALTGLAVLPFAVWLAMMASLALEDRHADDAVVMDAVVLRAADSAGAPAALTQPLPRGAEVTVLEARDAWTKVRLASGTAGWLPAGTIQRVSLR